MKISEILNEIEEEELQAKQNKWHSLSYKKIFFKYSQKWRWFLISGILSVFCSFAYFYFATPLYEIKSTLLLKDEKKGTDFNSNAIVTNMQGFNSSSSVENEAEVLRAEQLMIKAAQELEFSTGFFIPNGLFRWKEIYQNEVPFKLITLERNEGFKVDVNSFFISIINQDEFQLQGGEGFAQSYKFGQTINNFYGKFSIVQNPDYQEKSENEIKDVVIVFFDPSVGRELAKNLEVQIVNKLASVIELSILMEHPKKGQDLLLKIIELYNREADEEKNRTARNTINFIDEQLIGLTQELEDIENQAETYKLNNSITDIGAEAQLFLNSTTTNRQQLAELSVQIDLLESIEKYMDRIGNENETVPGTLTVSDPTLNELISSFNKLQQEKERMLRTTQPSNPIVINLSQQLSSLRNSIIENIRHIKNGLLISRNSLQSASNQYQNRASKVPTIEKELLDINRKQGIKQEHYLLLIQKREEAALALAAASVGNSRIISPPIPSEFPVKPNKIIIFAFSLLVGLGFPFGLIFLKDNWEQKIIYKSDVESLTQVPIIGEISKNKTSNGLIAISKNRKDLIAEQFRFLRSNLAFVTHKKPNKTILVSSSVSGEGKTFICVNLAISLGMAGKSVVILEFDLRKPDLLASLGYKADLGISDFLVNPTIDLMDIIQPMESYDKIGIIGCGGIPENPSEIMMTERLHKFFDELSRKFDHIIIDSAPIGLVSDSLILSEMADVTFMILRYNYSTKDHVKFIEELRKAKKMSHLYLVLNDVKPELIQGYDSKYAKKYYNQMT